MDSSTPALSRTQDFKGTIVIICIYAVFLLAISVIGMISPAAKEIIFVQGLPFTMTFITGTIFIIAVLVIQLFAVKPTIAPAASYAYSGENMKCPDFWVLKRTPESELNKITDARTKSLSKFYCENPNNPTASDVFTIDKPANASKEDQELSAVATGYNSLDAKYHMKCNRMYPDYMAYRDSNKDNFPDSQTAIRCNYLKKCNTPTASIPWTSVCPALP